MRLFRCERCASRIPFEAQRCGRCEATLGYMPELLDIRVLHSGEPPAYVVDADQVPQWRCLNAAWGCNWMLPAETDDVWCRSCRLTRGRPDESDPAAVAAWAAMEGAKRRLVHQLDSLHLPVDGRSGTEPGGLAFDLVHVPGQPCVTGHRDGIVTLDLTETDDGHREGLRRQLGEPFRTVLGHLRHEIGHYYWGRLLDDDEQVAAFRDLFGDERSDYAAALRRHHAATTPESNPARFVTEYAAAHPLEDWAETFAHYLHMQDASDTALAHGVMFGADQATLSAEERHGTVAFVTFLERWGVIAEAVNAIAGSLGAPAVYPFQPSGAVVEKLSFVHSRIRAVTKRDPFRAVRQPQSPRLRVVR